MRAVLMAMGYAPDMEGLAERGPSVMLPVAGRPLVQYVVEWLVDSGVTSIDCIVSVMPEQVETSLGDGARWGISIRYRVARDPVHPYGMLAVLDYSAEEQVVLAHADRLPLWKFDSSKVGLVVRNGEWTGWGIVPASVLNHLTGEMDEAGVFSELSVHRNLRVQEEPVLLSVRSFVDFMDANWTVLEKRFPGLQLSGREASEGVWISRNVSLHPTARLTAPAYIGENCRIAAGVQLGPRVVVGSDCFVDQSSELSEAVVFGGSYIGEALELKNAIVDRNCLVNVRVGAAVTVTDNFILGSLVQHHFRQFAQRLFSRIVAVLLLVLMSPLLLAAWLWCLITRRGLAIHRREVLRLPAGVGAGSETYGLVGLCASDNPSACAGRAHGFFLHLLPGLVNVCKGDLTLVGVTPRSAEDVESLPPSRKQLFLGSPAGLITEVSVVHGAEASEEQRYSAEVFYAAMAGPKHDAELIAAYCAQLLGFKKTVADSKE